MRTDSKHPLGDVINPKDESARRPRREENPSKRRARKTVETITDPVRCPMCLTVLQCPRNKDYEAFIAEKNLKCLHSGDNSCSVAVKSPTNAAYIKRLIDEKNAK
jgi:hypothetical protein